MAKRVLVRQDLNMVLSDRAKATGSERSGRDGAHRLRACLGILSLRCPGDNAVYGPLVQHRGQAVFGQCAAPTQALALLFSLAL